MWRALKDAGITAERGYAIREERARYNVDLAVPCAKGTIGIVIRERSPRYSIENVLHFKPKQITDDVRLCVNEVRQKIIKYGGAR